MRAVVLLVVLLAAGCVRDGDGGQPVFTPGVEPTAPPEEPPVVFGGIVIDGASGDVPEGIVVELDLAQTRPCARPGIGWATWAIPVAEGAFGPYEVPRPRSDDVAFFLRVTAPGYVMNMTHIGPQQARLGTHNLTIQLHRDANVTGSTAPGALVALDAPGFPRLAVADEGGAFRFDEARPVPTWVVVSHPQHSFRAIVTPPADASDVNETAVPGWVLEGVVKMPNGAGAVADVVAFNATMLVAAARAGDTGVFSMALPAEPGPYRIEARTEDGRFGATRALDVAGPPALRETLLLRALC